MKVKLSDRSLQPLQKSKIRRAVKWVGCHLMYQIRNIIKDLGLSINNLSSANCTYTIYFGSPTIHNEN